MTSDGLGRPDGPARPAGRAGGCLSAPAPNLPSAAANACVTRLPPSIHMLAAVDAHRRSGDEPRVLAAQEDDPARDFLGVAEAADRDFGDDFFEHLRRDRGTHVGVSSEEPRVGKWWVSTGR